ncbi:MAG TPA: hypothetical protein VMS65_01020 [Polyangiaceae bacterium]|nr:hypothetical protein [Polyangiaceae bacterium]
MKPLPLQIDNIKYFADTLTRARWTLGVTDATLRSQRGSEWHSS